MASSERISFKEYCDIIELSPMLRRAFETHCLGDSAKFNYRTYRTAQEWDRIKSEFLAADRGRRTHG